MFGTQTMNRFSLMAPGRGPEFMAVGPGGQRARLVFKHQHISASSERASRGRSDSGRCPMGSLTHRTRRLHVLDLRASERVQAIFRRPGPVRKREPEYHNE